MDNVQLEKKIKHKKRQRLRNGLSLTLAFILAMLMLCISVLFGVYVGVFNEDVILTQLNKSGYYEKVRDTIEDNLVSDLLPTGLPWQKILMNVVTLERVYIDAKQNIEAALHENVSTINESEIEATLKNNMEEYIANNKVEKTKEVNEGISELSTTLTKEYIRLLQFPFVKYFIKYKGIYEKLIKLFVPIILLLIAVIIITLIKMQYYKHRALRYIAYSCTAASIMLFLIPAYLLLSGIYRNIHIAPLYFYNFIVSYLRWDIIIFLYIGAFWLAVLSGLLISIFYLKKRG